MTIDDQIAILVDRGFHLRKTSGRWAQMDRRLSGGGKTYLLTIEVDALGPTNQEDYRMRLMITPVDAEFIPLPPGIRPVQRDPQTPYSPDKLLFDGQDTSRITALYLGGADIDHLLDTSNTIVNTPRANE